MAKLLGFVSRIIICLSFIGVASSDHCTFIGSGRISVSHSSVYYFPGFYVDPYQYGLSYYNSTGEFQSVNNDYYQIGWYHCGCNYVTNACPTCSWTLMQPIASFNGNFVEKWESYGETSLFTYGQLSVYLKCENSGAHGGCQITYTNVTMCAY